MRATGYAENALIDVEIVSSEPRTKSRGIAGFHQRLGGSRVGKRDVIARPKNVRDAAGNLISGLGSFQDVNRACDRWLMENNESFRRERADWYRRNPRFARS